MAGHRCRGQPNGHEGAVKLLHCGLPTTTAYGHTVGASSLHRRHPAQGREVVVELLLARDDVDVNLKDNYDWMPLSWAGGNGHEGVVKLLLTRDDIDLNSRDKCGLMP